MNGWLSIREAAAATDVTERTIRTWINDGLRSVVIFGKRYVPEDDLMLRFRSMLRDTRTGTRYRNRT